MSEPSTPSAAPPAVTPDDLRIVLFGMPAAGKSSLLGALAQAAQVQEHLLSGRLDDRSRSHGLDELRHRLYDESARRTAEEVVPYPVTYEPFSRNGSSQPGAGGRLGAVVIDCDGRVANDLLVRHQALDDDTPEGTLAREVVEADTLILVIDASAPPSQVDSDFQEFDRFLKQLERGRGQRAEVAGLPVFLVLTKCDLLAQPGDTAADWMDGIEQKKRDVDARFRDFLASRATSPAFGRIDLHIWATAVKRPALAGVPAKAREPYGVAELFRQCLEEAAEFRRHERRSTRRLAWTVGIASVLVTGMLGLTVGLYLQNRTTRARDLQARVEDFRLLDRGGPAERLRGTPEELRRKRDSLLRIREDPVFPDLPDPSRSFVEERLSELDAYIPYWERLRKGPSPASARTESALAEIEEKLRKDPALPREEWAETEAGKLHGQRLAEAEALRKAITTACNWYQDGTDAGAKLWTFANYKSGPEEAGIDWSEWDASVEKLLDPNRRPPFAETDPIPGSPTPVTYAAVLRFESVVEARVAWEAEKARLKRLLDLTSALGLAPASKQRPALLVIPRDFTLAQARPRLMDLRAAYPDYAKEFTRTGLPDAIVPKVRQVARGQLANLLKPGRAEVLRQLRLAGRGTEETAKRWNAVRDWLKEPEELTFWRVLATTLTRLDEPEAEDPVAALYNFLGKKQFEIVIKRVELEIPDRLGIRPRPEARFLVMAPEGNERGGLAFTPAGEPRREARRRVRVYGFRLAEGQRLTYRPGDNLWAELPLSGDRGRLVWSECRSLRYRFERLRRPPRRQANKAGIPLTEGVLLEEVRLALEPEDGVPRVPDLMPWVRLRERE